MMNEGIRTRSFIGNDMDSIRANKMHMSLSSTFVIFVTIFLLSNFKPVDPVFASISMGKLEYYETMVIALNLAFEKYKSGEYAEAIEYVDKILVVEELYQHDPIEVTASGIGGLASIGLGQYEDALDYFESAFTVDPTDGTAIAGRDLATSLIEVEDTMVQEEDPESSCIEDPVCRNIANQNIENSRRSLPLPDLDLFP